MNSYQELIKYENEHKNIRAKLFIKGFIVGFAICMVPVAGFAVIAEFIKRTLN